jgi:hypothetical protein
MDAGAASAGAYPLATRRASRQYVATTVMIWLDPQSCGRMNDCVADWFIIHICRCIDSSDSLCNTARWFDRSSSHLASSGSAGMARLIEGQGNEGLALAS